MPHEMAPPDLEAAFRATGELLAADGYSVAVVVVGGAALALRGIVGRGTFDVDVIARAEDRGDGVVLEDVRRR